MLLSIFPVKKITLKCLIRKESSEFNVLKIFYANFVLISNVKEFSPKKCIPMYSKKYKQPPYQPIVAII